MDTGTPSLSEWGRSLQHKTSWVFSRTVLTAEEGSCIVPEVGIVEISDFSTVPQPDVASIVVIVVVVLGDVVVGAVVIRTLNTKHKSYVSGLYSKQGIYNMNLYYIKHVSWNKGCELQL